ncbi:MAG TPA: chemotaxis protein CheB [Anaerolineales bacterium]|nr:chemotaxis protein CheB [Anaerolineales bacterium]
MASKSNNKKSQQSPPAAQRKPRKTNKVNLHGSRNDEITIVGIGASAGGLKALQQFFEALPGNTGMAYVVITHLHPEHESFLAELLQRYTHMPVQQVTGLVPAERDHVYVIPPNRELVMQDSHIDITEFKEPRGQRAPIDYFFRSLARGHPNSVGIILSGGGTDGAVGVKAIKEEGGLLMVQQPDEAEYDSMPRAAIATNLADVVLPVKELAEKLVQFTRFTPPLPSNAEELTEQQLELMQRIIAHVHARTGHDFNHYKRATILRRIQRRMQIYSVSTLETYLETLRQNPTEATALFNDILIGVTSFFRDRESWEKLATDVIPQIIRKRLNNESVRAWTIGCSTGEEAYGLAILLFEAFDKLETHPRVQIFASDLDENSIRQAREGLYPAAIEADVSPERLARFFIRQGNHYRVRREVRDVVLFTHHSVLRDAPFSRLDLITCRNLLIYLQRDIQATVFDVFHYSLRTGGYLFLGGSESIEATHELFQTTDKTHRIYQTKPLYPGRLHVPVLPLAIRTPIYTETYSRLQVPRPQSTAEIERASDEHAIALEAHAPPSVLVNDKYMVLHVSETAGRYLIQPSGPITTDLLRLVRPELQLELRTALLRVFERDEAILTQPIPVQFNGHAHRVILSIQPRTAAAGKDKKQEKQALVFFLEDSEVTALQPAQEKDETHRDVLLQQLEREVRHLREQLQDSIEGHETSNEELKASNEELQSINEEYRSATEELETSKEELQSVNEELLTVNNELKIKFDEVSRAHTDLQNFMNATEIAMLFLDRDFRIRHYTPGMRELFNIMPGDRGRPIKHLTHTLQYTQFFEDAETVLRTLIPVEREVQGKNGGWFLLRMRPYRTLEDRIEGVIFTFVEITRLKEEVQQRVKLSSTLEQSELTRIEEMQQANQKIARARDLFYVLFDTNPIPTALIRQEDLTFLYANTEFLNYFQRQSSDVIGHDASEFSFGLGLEDYEQENLRTQLQKDGTIRNMEFQIQYPSGGTRTILASFQYLNLDGTDSLITTFIDITERVHAEQKIRSLAAELTGTQQAERHRLSLILHDDLQQRLFAVQMHMSFLRDAYNKNDLHAFQADFPQLEEWLAEAIRVTRQLSVDLSPPILHGEGLVEAVIWLAAQMNEQYGLRIDIKANGMPPEIDEKVRVLVFYAVRELLFNIVKHAGTLEAAVRFDHFDSQLLVIVKDHGVGFDSRRIMNDSKLAHGLMVIQDRLNLLGCKIKVTSQPGDGTEAIIEVPYEKVETNL